MVFEERDVLAVSNVVKENCSVAGSGQEKVVSARIHAQLTDLVELVFESLRKESLLSQVSQKNSALFRAIQGEASRAVD